MPDLIFVAAVSIRGPVETGAVFLAFSMLFSLFIWRGRSRS
jgi:hypothetical protein